MSKEMDRCPQCGQRVLMIEIDRYRVCAECRRQNQTRTSE